MLYWPLPTPPDIYLTYKSMIDTGLSQAHTATPHYHWTVLQHVPHSRLSVPVQGTVRSRTLSHIWTRASPHPQQHQQLRMECDLHVPPSRSLRGVWLGL